jgi:hypothetical protein
MAGTWQEALMLLHENGWTGEHLDEACEALVESCLDGEMHGLLLRELQPSDVSQVLRTSVSSDEARALCRVAEVRELADEEGERVRDAFRDLDAFVNSLSED